MKRAYEACRKFTIALDDPEAEAHVQDIIKDDDYVFAEFPRINPHYKVSVTASLALNETLKPDQMRLLAQSCRRLYVNATLCQEPS